jgi:ribonuclease-3
MNDFSATSAETPEALEARLGHVFRDRALLARALRHASLGDNSNERLEFLGDRILGLIVAERLFATYPATDEGGLAVRLNALVRREACAAAAERAGLGAFLHMAPSELLSGGRRKMAILANAAEAIIAALYLDGGYEAARAFVFRYWDNAFDGLAPELRDAKTMLQEWAQSGALPKRAQPSYHVAGREGPDHAPEFKVEVTLPGLEPETGHGPTKREAEQDAARRLLIRVGQWKEQ